MKSCWYAAIIVATIAPGSGAAIAQAWPSKPIRAFIPFAAGSATHIVPRAVFEPLGAELGQSIIVENRGGTGEPLAWARSGPTPTATPFWRIPPRTPSRPGSCRTFLLT